jgi:hypothetical protein
MASDTAGSPTRDREDFVQQSAVGRPQAYPPVTGETTGPVTPVSAAPVTTHEVPATRDRVAWGPIWAGLIATLPTFLVLELLAYGLGLGTTSGSTNAWITGVIVLLAFFVGGWVAGKTSAVRGTAAGLMTGFLVWGLGTTIILMLSLLGLGQVFGAAAQFFAAGNRANAGNVPLDPNQVAQFTRLAAWGGFLSLIVSALAAMLGSWLGSAGRALGRVQTHR